MKRNIVLVGTFMLFFTWSEKVFAQIDPTRHVFGKIRDTTKTETLRDSVYERFNVFGLEIMLWGSGGFGLGLFYRHRLEIDSAWYWFISFSVSEIKDDGEIEYYDYWTDRVITLGKLSRFYTLPFFVGFQHRLWKNDIVDNFRPYVTVAAGPAIVFVAPFVEEEKVTFEDGSTVTFQKEVDFFKSLGRGRAHYTIGGYLGAGAFFGSLNSPIGLSARYVYLPVFGGLPSMGFGDYSLKKYNFGGFSIVLSFGL
jgi:hypothetical protein